MILIIVLDGGREGGRTVNQIYYTIFYWLHLKPATKKEIALAGDEGGREVDA